MKRCMFILMLLIVFALVSCATPTVAPTTAPAAPTAAPAVPTAAPAKATQPPAGGEKITVTWATLAGFYTDWAEQVSKEFEQKTGMKVQIYKIEYPNMYEKEVLDILSGTGAYDIVTWNVSWKAEWANNGYLLPLDDYIKKEDPKEIQIEDISPALMRIGGYWRGKTYGLVYYTFTPGMFYRCDLFEDPGEMAAFQAKYNYKLDIPKNYEQMHDIAEFFRRKPGETLKGQKLDKDFYGIGLMAGRHTQLADEIFTLAWTYGGDVIKDDGSPGVTDPAYLKAMHTYVDQLLPYAPPGSLSGSYDFVVGQFRSGLIPMTGVFYLDQWPNAVQMEKDIPGSELCIGGLEAGGKTWAGPFTLGINKSSKHPDAAWQFLKWITGPEAQRKFALGGGSTTRLSILKDPAVYKVNREMTGHFPALAQVLDHAAKCWYTNFLWTPQDAKIYEESAQWHSAATSKQMSVEESMNNFSSAINKICNGKCPIFNEGVPRPKPTDDCSYTFDKSLQMRKVSK